MPKKNHFNSRYYVAEYGSETGYMPVIRVYKSIYEANDEIVRFKEHNARGEEEAERAMVMGSATKKGNWIVAGGTDRIYVGDYKTKKEAEALRQGYMDGWNAKSDDPLISRSEDRIDYKQTMENARAVAPYEDIGTNSSYWAALNYGEGFANAVCDRSNPPRAGAGYAKARKPAFSVVKAEHRRPVGKTVKKKAVPAKRKTAPKKK